MYNIHVSAHQTLGGTLLNCSLSETDDLGNTYQVAEFRLSDNSHFAALEEDSLEEFLEQVLVALVKGVSTRTGSMLIS